MTSTARSPLHTPERVRLVDKMAELGPRFAARADAVDQTASFPHENWADLRDAGFLGVAVPERDGGLGADFVGYALVAEELARHKAFLESFDSPLWAR